MTNSFGDIVQEAVHEIEFVCEQGGVKRLDKWMVVDTILAKHPRPDFDDVAFFDVTATHATHAAVREALRVLGKRLDADLANDKQMTLKGVVVLQPYYSIEKDGEPVIVALEEMTRQEIRQKRTQLRRNGTTLIRHADELERYELEKFGPEIKAEA